MNGEVFCVIPLFTLHNYFKFCYTIAFSSKMRSTHQSTRLNFIPDETALDVWKRIQESDSIVPQEVETAGFADSFQPSYAEPIRQPASNSLSIRLSNNQIQELKFHEGIEIQAVSSEVPEVNKLLFLSLSCSINCSLDCTQYCSRIRFEV